MLGKLWKSFHQLADLHQATIDLYSTLKRAIKINNNFRKNMNKLVLPEAKVVRPWYSVSIQWDSPTSTYLAFV